MKTTLLLLLTATFAKGAIPVEIVGPAGSEAFGTHAVVLPNGNIVITDPMFDRQIPPTLNVGAVYLYKPDGTLISRITGTTAEDHVGGTGVAILGSGNFLVQSPDWDNGANVDAGAVTFGNADFGFDVTILENITSSNSLVGTHTNDSVGQHRVDLLNNGHYVVVSPEWDNGAATNAGAVTWGHGWRGVTGAISASNSLVGSTTNDSIAAYGLVPLPNSNYVASSPDWDNGGIVDAGSVVLCSGTGPTTGVINSSNALIGTVANDSVGDGGIYTLESGNFVVMSWLWDNGSAVDAGAATWVDGVRGITGEITASNSLVGSSNTDYVGASGLIPLRNGHYVLLNHYWDGATPDVGAITWGNGFTGVSGPITTANSVIGQTAGDRIGSGRGRALANGNYVVGSPEWDNGAVINAGAVTWFDGSGPATGSVTTANSLYGTSGNDSVGTYEVLGLSNGHYVVLSPLWDNGAAADAGAVTWCNGSKGLIGPVGADNSLVGGTTGDSVGLRVIPLKNDNYVTCTERWDNGAAVDAGAATWCSGTKATKGLVSKSNSLVGLTSQDWVGTDVLGLENGNYVIFSPRWDNGSASDVGAVTWGKGTSGVKGAVSTSNSLIGEHPSDFWNARLTSLNNGNYVVYSPDWNGGLGCVTWGSGTTGVKGVVSSSNSLVGSGLSVEIGDRSVRGLLNGDYYVISGMVDNGYIVDAGAVTLCNGTTGSVGFLSPANSVFGTISNGGSDLSTARGVDITREQLVITWAKPNTVVLFGNYFPRSLAKTNAVAPGSPDIAFSTIGSAAVSSVGGAVFDYTLTGAGSKSGKNKGLFATMPYAAPTEMVLQTGDFIEGFEDGARIDGTATAITNPLNLQFGRSLFQMTVSGTGITSSNNKLLMLDSGVWVIPVLRTGQSMAGLGTARISTFREVVQSEEDNLVVLSYQLASSSTAGVNSGNDTGILPLTHGGGINVNAVIAREGSTSFVTGGTLGQFSGKAAAGYGVIHFNASFKPTAGSAADAVFRFDTDGSSAARVAMVGESPPDISGDPDVATVKYSSFPAITQQIGSTSDDVLFKAILNSGESARNEGIWRLPHSDVAGDQRIVRKGDQVTGLPSGIVFSSLTRFWPANDDQVIIQAKISGPGVASSNNQVLALRQADGNFLVLLRTGDSPNGIGTAKISAFSAVEVDPNSGIYAVLTSLSGAPSNANQALWMGNPSLGADSPADQQAYRLPHLRLRKGDRYSSNQTDSAVIKSITMKPFVDSSGAGNRGQSRCMSSAGAVAVYLLIDRSITELVMLPQLLAPP